VLELVDLGYVETDAIPDPEAKERMSADRQLPASGMQTHFEYSVHAHFRLLRRLLGGTGKVRFFFDLDDTIRAACLSAFKSEISEGKVDAFFSSRASTGMGGDSAKLIWMEARPTASSARSGLVARAVE
jgi:hypothetical protein